MIQIDLEALSNDEIEEMARQTHYSLREKLVTLRSNPPIEAEPLTMLNNVIAALMRALDEYHSHYMEGAGGS